MTLRVYCNGRLTREQLKAKLEQGLVCTDVIRDGYTGGDVAYFRPGTTEEIAQCQQSLFASEPK